MTELFTEAGADTEDLLMYGNFDSRIRDRAGNSLLYAAVKAQNMGLIRLLTERFGQSPLDGNLYGDTPLSLSERMAERADGTKGQENALAIEQYLIGAAGVKPEDSYLNPVRRGFFPDPSVIRVGDTYYMANSSFTYVPGIPISESRDLVHWKIIGHAITDPAVLRLQGEPGGYGFWAPDIAYIDGRFVITVTLRSAGSCPRVQLIVSSDRPEGPYANPVWVEEDGIDPSLFVDDDGRKYMLVNCGAKLVPLADDFSKAGPARILWMGHLHCKPEGPHMIRKDDWYYLFLAEGGTGLGHSVTVARSRTLTGPFESCPMNPILHQSDPYSVLQCLGHSEPVSTPDGRWYLFCLGNRFTKEGHSFTGRETCVFPLTWAKDGWPIVSDGNPQMQGALPFAGETGEGRYVEEEEAAMDCSPLYWYGVRGPAPENSEFKPESRQLALKGDGYPLTSLAGRSVLLRRQDSFRFRFSCLAGTQDLNVHEQAGLVLYYDESSFVQMGMKQEEDGRYLVCRRKAGGKEPLEENARQKVKPEGQIRLIIEGEDEERRFLWEEERGDVRELTAFDTPFLCSEGLPKGKHFTGCMVGMYVEGTGTAHFTEYAYENLDRPEKQLK